MPLKGTKIAQISLISEECFLTMNFRNVGVKPIFRGTVCVWGEGRAKDPKIEMGAATMNIKGRRLWGYMFWIF